MSTQSLEPPSAAESDDSALIARLFAESWRNPLPGSDAVGVAEPPPVHASPVAEPGLTGGYPSPTIHEHPPVHPNVVAPEPASPPVPEGTATPSSAIDEGAAHEFGEPRFRYGGPAAPQTSHPPLPDAAAHRTKDTPALDSATLYFLQDLESTAPRSLTGPTSPTSLTSPKTLDLEKIRLEFPALHQRINGHPLIWFDNAATTHKPRAVIEATSRFYGRDNSNIHRAAHTLAERSTELFEQGREKVRRFIGAADAKEIIFVRGTTEGINLIAQTYGRRHVGPGDEILLSALEHHANIVPWQILAEQTGGRLRVIPIDDRGALRLDTLPALINERTRIVSITQVSNALGTVTPVHEVIRYAHARGVPVVVDGAQSVPHFAVDVRSLDADFFVFSGHKVFGPTGIGVVYGKAALLESLPPWQGGGHMIKDVTFERTIYQHSPERFEAGTPDIAGVVGLSAALDFVTETGIAAIADHEHRLLEYATARLQEFRDVRPVGTAANKAGVLGFVVPGLANERIAAHLDAHGIAVRAGHHCAMPAVRHFGLESTVRASFAFYNTREEIDTFVRVLSALLRR